MKISALNVIPRFQNETELAALERATELVRIIEDIGYYRYWISEYHNFPGVISSATDILIQHFLQNSKKIKVGAGGVMMPNHTPLQVAERYGTLNLLYPNRVDLGIGRAPSTDKKTAHLIKRGSEDSRSYIENIKSIQRFLGSPINSTQIQAIPGQNQKIPIYILGSTLNSAYIAAELGLPYAFAGHFSQHYMSEAINIYRTEFRASEYLAAPYVILSVLGLGAEDLYEAEYLYSATQHQVYRGSPDTIDTKSQLEKTYFSHLTSAEKLFIETRLGIRLIGSKKIISEKWQTLKSMVEPDELMIVSYLPEITQLETSYQIIYDAIQ